MERCLFNIMRTINITDEKTLKALNSNSEINKDQTYVIKRLREIEVEGKELEERFNKNMAQSERAMEKARPLIKKIVEKETLGEFEEVSKVVETKDENEEGTGQWQIEIADRMEEFKAAWEHRNDPKEEVKEEPTV